MKEGYLYLIVSNEDQDAPGEVFHCHPLHALVECVDANPNGSGDMVGEGGMHQTLYPEHVEEVGEI